MALEWLTGSLIYSFAKDLVGNTIRIFKPMPPQQKIELRQKWKPRFEEHIRDHFARELRSDVIIRDVKRVDQYPDSKENEKGISAWFRLGLVGTYHRGILVAFHWNELVEVGEGKFRFLDHKSDNQETKDDALKVLQIGMIPFENIQDVDFEGDEYYNYPHIYCHFSNKGEPYERVAYFTQNQLFKDSLPYHTEVAEAKAVRDTSRKLGVKSPYI
ncbi:hypothetical protein [Thioclava indica]|uniref:Uncharacterized protein n=1 Tax=Thioclava indica TaxID=1353528 RepID=A0A074JXQ1_9RHOB|nr:hypothetical protein [Thioclava indica]KEO60635.1 hypothetical protein DT23_13015 [Thioclava indica]